MKSSNDKLLKGTKLTTYDSIREGYVLPFNEMPKPIYYKKKYLLFSTTCSSRYSGIYLYDINQNKWILFCRYHPILSLLNHNHTLDTKNNTLYIFGGKYNEFTKVNMNNKRKLYYNESTYE